MSRAIYLGFQKIYLVLSPTMVYVDFTFTFKTYV